MSKKEMDDALSAFINLPAGSSRLQLETAVKDYVEKIKENYSEKDTDYYPVYQFFKQYHGDPEKQQKPDPMWLEKMVGTKITTLNGENKLTEVKGWPVEVRDHLKKILAIIALRKDKKIDKKTKLTREGKIKDTFFINLINKIQTFWRKKQRASRKTKQQTADKNPSKNVDVEIVLNAKTALDELIGLDVESITREKLENAVKNYAKAIYLDYFMYKDRKEFIDAYKCIQNDYYPMYKYFLKYYGHPMNEKPEKPNWLEILINTKITTKINGGSTKEIIGWNSNLRELLKSILDIINLRENKTINQKIKQTHVQQIKEQILKNRINMKNLLSTKQMKSQKIKQQTTDKNPSTTGKKESSKKDNKLMETCVEISKQKSQDLDFKNMETPAIGILLRFYRDYRRHTLGIKFGPTFLKQQECKKEEKIYVAKEFVWLQEWEKLTNEWYSSSKNHESIKLLIGYLLASKQKQQFIRLRDCHGYFGLVLKYIQKKSIIPPDLKMITHETLTQLIKDTLKEKAKQIPWETIFQVIKQTFQLGINHSAKEIDAFLTLIEWDNDGFKYDTKLLTSIKK